MMMRASWASSIGCRAGELHLGHDRQMVGGIRFRHVRPANEFLSDTQT